MVNGLYDTRLS